jgi:hypothetical protein
MYILQPEPDCFSAWFNIAFTSQEAANAGDLSQDIVETRPLRRRFVVQQISGVNLVRIEEQCGIKVGADSSLNESMLDGQV